MSSRPQAVIRHDLRPGDLGAVVHAHGTVYAREYGFDETFEAYVAGPMADFVRTRGPRDRLWIAEQGDRLVGCIAIVDARRQTAEPAHVTNAAQLRWFLVHPEARGAGLGRRLLTEAVDFSKRCGYDSIFLWTVNVLTAAAHLYHAFGYRKVEDKPGRLWGVDVIEEQYLLRL